MHCEKPPKTKHQQKLKNWLEACLYFSLFNLIYPGLANKLDIFPWYNKRASNHSNDKKNAALPDKCIVIEENCCIWSINYVILKKNWLLMPNIYYLLVNGNLRLVKDNIQCEVVQRLPIKYKYYFVTFSSQHKTANLPLFISFLLVY